MGRQCSISAGKQSIAAAWVARVGRVRSCVDDLALYPSYKIPPQTAQAKKTGSPKGCRLFIAIGAAYGAMRERGRLRLDKLMP